MTRLSYVVVESQHWTNFVVILCPRDEVLEVFGPVCHLPVCGLALLRDKAIAVGRQLVACANTCTRHGDAPFDANDEAFAQMKRDAEQCSLRGLSHLQLVDEVLESRDDVRDGRHRVVVGGVFPRQGLLCDKRQSAHCRRKGKDATVQNLDALNGRSSVPMKNGNSSMPTLRRSWRVHIESETLKAPFGSVLPM